jgi:hypothetical protein
MELASFAKAMPIDSDQLGEVRRAARQLGGNPTPLGADDFRAFDGSTYGEYGFSDDGRRGRRARGTTEVHTKVAMSVFVSMVTEAVCRIGAQPDDQCDGRNKGDQTITELAGAQGVEPLFKGQSSVACESPASNSCDNAR